MKPNVFRIRVLFGFILLIACVFAVRLYTIQVIGAEKYSDKANKQSKKPISNIFNRGTIYFTKKDGGTVSAGTQKTGFIVAINPSTIKDADGTYDKLFEYIPTLNKESFMARATKKDDPYEEVFKRLDEDSTNRIVSAKIPNVNLYKEKWRFYPGESMASHALGIVAYKGDELGGRYGLEKFYENTLQRKNESTYINFFTEIFSNIKSSLSSESKMEGDIVTTIEPSVQAFFERTLEQINSKWSSEYTGGIIIDPKTGEIIAMGMYPTFNPNNFQQQKNSAIFSNPLVENVYEMGSIIKPLTMASGIDNGSVTSATTYDDKGSLTLNNKKISNWDGKARGVVSMQEVLNQSLNIGAVFVMQKMGKEKFSEYMLNFGLGEKTNIDLPNESLGIVENLKSPRDIEHATASFGQGIAFSPMATVRAMSVLANGGTLITPHLVSKINYTSGLSKTISSVNGRRVIKAETSEAISRMLVEAVDSAKIYGKIRIPNYNIAAKTGTAQIAKKEGGGYYDDRFLHSFFGYFPAYNPRFLVFLYTYYPKGIGFSSETLPTPFMTVAQYLINYYEIPPDR